MILIKRIIGILVVLAGIALIGTSMYITDQVNAGKIQINDAQQQVDQGKSLFSKSPVTKPVGDILTNSAQKKIDAGKAEVTDYEKMASNLKISGIVVIVVGIGVVLIGNRKKKR